MNTHKRWLGGLLLALGVSTGCNMILGIDKDYYEGEGGGGVMATGGAGGMGGTGGAGGAGGMGSTGGAGGMGGAGGAGGMGGAGPCTLGATKSCYTGDPQNDGKGICVSGTTTCDDQGQWGACVGAVMPLVESCNGLDDDCDGEVDEGCPCNAGQTQPCYHGPASTIDVGPCKQGQQSCTNGTWDACTGDKAPELETCDGIDNDCDGQADDGITGLGDTCTPNLPGPCGQNGGVTICTSGGMICEPNTKPGTQPETCNGVDDDCDGKIDNGNLCCPDQMQNGNETDVDCGGSCPTKCDFGKACLSGLDCASALCTNGFCAKWPIGATCSAAADCASGHCVDGFCCDTACNGTCQACSAAKKGQGTNGTCGPIKSGLDPDAECTDQGPQSCGTSGACNGASACAIYQNGTVCQPASCAADGITLNKADTCSSGLCADSGTQDCSPYPCVNGACATNCSNDSGCLSTHYCDLTQNPKVCVAKKATGQGCGGNNQCVSNRCTSGICEPATCGDGSRDGDETDVDCGGSCVAACADGKGCMLAIDCVSQVCTGQLCQAPTCFDGVQNGTETLRDCGGNCPCTVLFLGARGSATIGASFQPTAATQWVVDTNLGSYGTGGDDLALTTITNAGMPAGIGLLRKSSDYLQQTNWTTSGWTDFNTIGLEHTDMKPSITSTIPPSSIAHGLFRAAPGNKYYYLAIDGTNMPSPELVSDGMTDSTGTTGAGIAALGNNATIAFLNTGVFTRDRDAAATPKWLAEVSLASIGNLMPEIVTLSTGTQLLAIADSTNKAVYFATRPNGGSWSPLAPAVTLLATESLTNRVSLAALPDGNAAMALRDATGNKLYVSFYNGTTWSAATQVSNYTTGAIPAISRGVGGYAAELAFADASDSGRIYHTRCTALVGNMCASWTTKVMVSSTSNVTSVAIASWP